MTCRNCGKTIVFNEYLGWVHSYTGRWDCDHLKRTHKTWAEPATTNTELKDADKSERS